MSCSEAACVVGDVPATAPITTAPDWLTGLHDELGELNGCVGNQFQALADALQSLSGEARQIACLSREATGLATAGKSGEALALLQQILDEAERVQTPGDTSQEKLHAILAHLEQSRAPLGRLGKLPFLLRAIGTLSRVEGSRIHSTTVDVSGLAADIERLAEGIEKHVASITGEAGKLAELGARSARQLDEIKCQEREQAADLTGRSRAVIDSFRMRTEASKSAAGSIDEQYAGIGGAIDRIIMSLQSEDIVRQRLEHVQQALRHADAGESQAGILALQRSQLFGARKLVFNSISSIHDSLGSLAAHLDELTAETAALAVQTDQDGKSFTVSVGDGLGAVASVIGQYSASARAVVATVDAVLPALASMSSSASEVEEIQSSIQLIALNASIKTAHLGIQGAAMGVLASELQKITTHSQADSRVILESLQAMDGAMKAISGQDLASSALLMSSGGDEVGSEVQRLSQAVTESHREMSLKLSTVRETADTLRGKLADACRLAGRGEAVAQAFDRVLRTLDCALERLGCTSGTTLEAMGKQASSLSSLYSMQEERQVHQQVFGSAADDAGEHVAEHAIATTDGLGDGIELF